MPVSKIYTDEQEIKPPVLWNRGKDNEGINKLCDYPPKFCAQSAQEIKTVCKLYMDLHPDQLPVYSAVFPQLYDFVG